MRVEHTHGVVDPLDEDRLEIGPRDPHDHGGDRTREQSTQAVDETRGRGDSHQAHDHAVDGAEERRFLGLAQVHVTQHPGQQRADRGDVRVDNGGRRVSAREVRVTTVEPVPAEPHDAGADGDQREAMWQEPLAVACQAWADDPGRDKSTGTSCEVDDVATGVVDCALVRPVTAAPQEHGVDGVHERRPQRDEDHPDPDLDATEDATQEQQRGDGREHELEVEQRGRRLRQRKRCAAIGEQTRLGNLRRSS